MTCSVLSSLFHLHFLSHKICVLFFIFHLYNVYIFQFSLSSCHIRPVRISIREIASIVVLVIVPFVKFSFLCASTNIHPSIFYSFPSPLRHLDFNAQFQLILCSFKSEGRRKCFFCHDSILTI